MSTVEPFGTWQYAQAVCCPAGARVGSKRLCWASSTYGRSAISPAPRRRLRRRDLLQRGSEVDGRGACALLGPPGDRPVERPVELEHARPVAVALEPAAIARRGGGRRPGRAGRAASRRGARDASRRARRATRLAVPSRSRRRASAGSEARASESRCEPPRGNGQPTACAEQPEHQAEGRARRAVEPAASSGRRAPRRRRAPSRPRKASRASSVAGSAARSAEAGQRERVRGNVQRREQVLEQRLGIAGERREDAAATGRRPRRARARPPPASARAGPRCRRRTGGRAPPAARSTRRRAPRAAACGRTATRPRAGGSPSRRRGRIPAASARPSARRRRPCPRPRGREREPRPRQHDRRGEAVRAGADDDGVRHGRSLDLAPHRSM